MQHAMYDPMQSGPELGIHSAIRTVTEPTTAALSCSSLTSMMYHCCDTVYPDLLRQACIYVTTSSYQW